MNELLEYKNVFLNYPRKSIKEMTELLKQNKEEFVKAYMHNVYIFAYKLYNMFPIYFEYNDVMDVISEGNELIVKLYNKGIRNYKAFSYYMYYTFYIRNYNKIKINIIVFDKYDEFTKTNKRNPDLQELSNLTNIYPCEIMKNCTFLNNITIYSNELTDDPLNHLINEERNKEVKDIFNCLDKIEMDVANKRYDQGFTLKKISDEYQISTDRIRTIDGHIRRKLLRSLYKKHMVREYR